MFRLLHTIHLVSNCLVFFAEVLKADGCKEMDFKVTLEEKTLANHVFKNVRATNDAHCESQCFLDDRCISYSYGTSADGQKYMCELNDSDHLMHPEDVVDRPGVIYRSAQNTCTCRGKQTCRFDFIKNIGECLCPPGFTGSTCETNINECSSDPCKNGGKCEDQLNGYECNCPAGYTGINCETNINDCISQPCVNGGLCVDGVNAFSCTCSAGHIGKTCQIDIRFYCEQVPDSCSGGATCKNQLLSPYYSCVCPLFYPYDSTNKICKKYSFSEEDDDD